VAYIFFITWVGAQEIIPATVLLGQVCTNIRFVYMLRVLPLLGWLETALVLGNSGNAKA
jgi:quinol-cytochrome oxidoreductase complex cytochrome b subunit